MRTLAIQSDVISIVVGFLVDNFGKIEPRLIAKINCRGCGAKQHVRIPRVLGKKLKNPTIKIYFTSVEMLKEELKRLNTDMAVEAKKSRKKKMTKRASLERSPGFERS